MGKTNIAMAHAGGPRHNRVRRRAIFRRISSGSLLTLGLSLLIAGPTALKGWGVIGPISAAACFGLGFGMIFSAWLGPRVVSQRMPYPNGERSHFSALRKIIASDDQAFRTAYEVRLRGVGSERAAQHLEMEYLTRQPQAETIIGREPDAVARSVARQFYTPWFSALEHFDEALAEERHPRGGTPSPSSRELAAGALGALEEALTALSKRDEELLYGYEEGEKKESVVLN